MAAEAASALPTRLSACTSSVLANPRASALFLDMDGTLLELAPTPRSVRVPDGLLDLLERLSIVFDGAVAIVTGRMIAEADLILSPLRLPASGVHGAEMRKGRDYEIERVRATLPDDLVHAMQRLAARIPGVLAEPKGPGLAIHYRLAPDAEALIAQELAFALERHAGAFHILPGKCLFEVVPAGLSKGTALAALSALPSFRDRLPIMIGDDIGDEAAFAAAEGLHGFGLRVAGEHYRHEIADFAGPRDVLAWLEHIASYADPSKHVMRT
jgi:trehalose 6-phosphate phosphatase